VHCADSCYTIQHMTLLTFFPFILHTIIIAQMLSIGVEKVEVTENLVKLIVHYGPYNATVCF